MLGKEKRYDEDLKKQLLNYIMLKKSVNELKCEFGINLNLIISIFKKNVSKNLT